MMSSRHAAPAPTRQPERNDIVRTPTGRLAKVLIVDDDAGEALVQWADGETARLRLKHLEPPA